MQQMQKSFYFHDYETFGISPSLDRPSQFAGIRTDMDFNIIGEPLVIYCKPQTDYLPQPEACLVTGITPQKALEHGLCEADFIRAIHAEFSTPDTCILGYNNIHFDDEVTRFTLYRNFYDPYEYSWQHGNSRWDLLDVVRACYALRPEGIEWVFDDEGKPRFRLEQLTAKNGIVHENAHDALSDVIATIELAKLVKKAQPKLFAYLFDLRHKSKVKDLIDVVTSKPLVHVSRMYPSINGSVTWIAPLAWHPTNTNAVIAVNLNQDITPLLELSVEEIQYRLYAKRDELGDQPRMPLTVIHTNKCPILAPAGTLTAERADELKLDREQCRKSMDLLKAHPELKAKLVEVYNQVNDKPLDPNPDTQLYADFFSPKDKALMQEVRNSSPEALINARFDFSDKRLAPLLFRYRARNWPHTLTDTEQKRWRLHCQDYFSSNIGDYGLRLEALVEANQGKEREFGILKSLYQYLTAM